VALLLRHWPARLAASWLPAALRTAGRQQVKSGRRRSRCNRRRPSSLALRLRLVVQQGPA